MPPLEIVHLVYGHYPADTRVKREARALRATGRRVAVITVRGAGERATERVDGVVAIRVPGRKSRGGFLSYLREYGEFVLRCRRLIASHRALAHVQVVHVHTLPDFLMWAALPAKRRGARIVFDMHEIFPEFARAKFPGAFGALVAGVARRIERWARRAADLTITVNRPIDELLAGRPAGPGEHRIVVHNTTDPRDFERRGQSAALTAPLQLVYHGTLTHMYGLDVAINGVAQANRDGFDVRLTIIGDGPERAHLESQARGAPKTGSVVLEAPITHTMLATRLPRFHAGVVPTRLNGMTRYSLSTKLLEYVQLGLPVLAADLPSYRLYFGDNTLWFWTPGEPASLAAAIRAFLGSARAERAARIARAQQLLEPLAWESQAEALVRAYTRLLSNHEAARISATRSAAVPSP